MTELFSNLGQTTTVGDIGPTDTSVIVAALNGVNPANSFPSSGNFRLIFGTDISSEIVLCTAVNPATNTLTIVRGQEGTLAKSWQNGTTISMGVTAQAVNQMRADLFQVGPYSARPTQGLPIGSYYNATDGHTPWIWDPNTGQWRPQISGVLGFQPPSASTFVTSINSPGSIVNSGRGALEMTGIADVANTTTFRGFAFPFSGPGFVEFGLQHIHKQPQTTNNWAAIGPLFYETASTKIYGITHGLLVSGAQLEYMETQVYSNPNTRTASSFAPIGITNGPFFLRIRRDLTNVYADFSRDRVQWINYETRTIASVFTTVPDQIGIGGFSAGFAGFWRIVHFAYGPLPTVPDTIFTANIHQLRAQVFMPPPNPPPVSPPAGWVSSIFNR